MNTDPYATGPQQTSGRPSNEARVRGPTEAGPLSDRNASDRHLGDRHLRDRVGDMSIAAVEATRMPMILTDPRQPDNPIVFANPAFAKMTGYAPEEIIGRNCRFLQGPDTDPETVADVRASIAARHEIAVEILNYRKDGYSFWNALFVSPIFDETGEVVYFFASQLDVSRRREAEEELRQAQKMEALGRLTNGVAHDFNNLLQVIVGYLELIDNGLRKPDIKPEKLLRGISNAQGAAERAAKLTQQLLSFARKQRLEGRVLNLNELVGTVREIASRTLGENVSLKSVLSPDLWNCRVDQAQVETALFNILINARAALVAQDDKCVTIETRNLQVERDDAKHHGNIAAGRYVVIAVTDNGSGVPAHVVERMIDPFFTSREEGKGTGLSLSMVYGFAKQSGGIAQVESVEGEGTTVRILFPAATEEVQMDSPHAHRAFDRPGDETILVVEDRADVAEMARMILEDLGYRVLQARDPEAALDMLTRDRQIDLLFTELIMAGEVNGVGLAREARRLLPHIKVLLTTGYTEASLERTDAGGREFDVLNKPYGRNELARKIRLVLDGPTGVS